ncbi:MAG: hypothetical protein HY332_06235 [Chloroflexi bacterium]|nr:hypothetical protein [Chloroflexota bacterium]
MSTRPTSRTLAANGTAGATMDTTVGHSAASMVDADRDLRYGLLELETGNMVGFFETEAAALAAVVDSIDRYGMEAVETLALAHFVSGEVAAVAEGEQLVEHALAAVRGKASNGKTASPPEPAPKSTRATA